LAPPLESGSISHGSKATAEEAAELVEALTWFRPGQLEALELACRERDRDAAEPVHRTTILSTLVDATVWTGLRRMDGTTYSSPPAPAPERGAPGD
jgi:hypothetical protein